MTENDNADCPECKSDSGSMAGFDRRHFLRVLGGTSAALAFGSVTGSTLRADDKPAAKAVAKPAEDLIRELFVTLDADQKKVIVMPWDHGFVAGKALPTRMRMYNAAINKKIGDVFTKNQQELLQRILRSISSDEEGFRRLTRNGTYDGSASFGACGANIFGDPTDGKRFAWVFTGHHLTVRCDGNSEEGAAFGGPMYYGHSPNGYSEKNVFNYQTKSVLRLFDALDDKQQQHAILDGSPGEQEPSVRFRKKGEKHPGMAFSELADDQKKLVEVVMRDVLSPYRKEDADEVMDIIKQNGGLDKIHLAFYKDKGMNDKQLWHFWRLEGPGFVWNYRVLPHVHTFVNISSKIG
jgi:hypothetical protein